MRRWVEWGLSEPGEPGLFDYVMIYVHGYRPGERVFALPAGDVEELLKFVRLVADNPGGGHAVTAREILTRLTRPTTKGEG